MTGAPARHRAARPIGVVSFAPLILSVSAAAALSRLNADATSTRVFVPVVLAIVIADVVTALALRLRVNIFLSVGLGCAVSLWGLLVAVDPSLFNPASPHFLHAGLLSRQLSAAHYALSNDGTPLPLLSGVVLVVGAFGGLAGALTRGLWAWPRRHDAVVVHRGTVVQCLAPSLAIFVYSTLVSAEQGRVAAVVSYLLGVLVFVTLGDRTASATAASTAAVSSLVTVDPSLSRPSPHRQAGSRRATGALAGCILMALVVVGAGAGLSGMRLTVFHVTPPPPPAGRPGAESPQGAPQNLLSGIDLVDNLLATEISESNTVIFRATSPVATYWQVGALTSFNGSQWLPTPGVGGALSGASAASAGSLGPGPLPSPAPTQTFTARVAITDFASRLLPAPPGTLSVSGLSGAVAIGQEGVLASAASGPGTDYTVTAPINPAIPTNGPQLASSDPRLAPYLALPAQPAVVAQLARQAVAGATTVEAKAQALVDYFRSGRFRYTLSPPSTSGPDPLVQFLTVTKAGFCQQFAGAYGVLARSLGIPTRLVVGFIAGQPGPGGVFTVTGADAHVWPQVYLGPAAGWVSVEPTPPASTGTPAAAGVLGPSRTAPSRTGGTTKTSAGAPAQTVPATTPAGSTGVARRGVHRHLPPSPGHRGWAWWVVAAVVFALLLLVIPALMAWRSRRWVARTGLQPDERVVRAWEHALGALRRTGLSHQVGETPGEYAARVRSVELSSDRPIEAGAVTDLAALVELACYTPRPCTPGQAAQAQHLASAIVTTNRSHRRRRAGSPNRSGPEARLVQSL